MISFLLLITTCFAFKGIVEQNCDIGCAILLPDICGNIFGYNIKLEITGENYTMNVYKDAKCSSFLENLSKGTLNDLTELAYILQPYQAEFIEQLTGQYWTTRFSLKYEEILSKFEYCLIKIDASVKTTC